jgi:CheY-like chemotaxis protein
MAYDLVVSDLPMPEIDSIRLLTRIRADASGSQVILGGETKMEVFDIKALRKCLNTQMIGQEQRYWPEVESTNAMALRLATEGAV